MVKQLQTIVQLRYKKMYKDWVETNIKEILDDYSKKFAIKLKFSPFVRMSFEDATTHTINQLVSRHGKLYVALSGGSDSMFLVKEMKARNIDFTPVIVDCGKWNISEMSIAVHWCYTNKIEPIKLTMTDDDFCKIYASIYKKWGNCRGIGAIPQIYSAMELKKIGINHIVTGVGFINDDLDDPRKTDFQLYDFYCELFDDLIVEHFFYDNLSIIDSYLSYIRDDHKRTDYLKSELYNLPYRPKLWWNFQSNIIPQNIVDKRPHWERIKIDFAKFREVLEKFVIQNNTSSINPYTIDAEHFWYPGNP